MIGATIYATVGCEEKLEHLQETYGIPRDHVFHSRDSSFLPGIMEATGDLGVDLVLHALPGGLLEASSQCVAKGGKMIDISNRDTAEGGRSLWNPRKPNVSYCAIDMLDHIQSKPEEGKRYVQHLQPTRQGRLFS